MATETAAAPAPVYTLIPDRALPERRGRSWSARAVREVPITWRLVLVCTGETLAVLHPGVRTAEIARTWLRLQSAEADGAARADAFLLGCHLALAMERP